MRRFLRKLFKIFLWTMAGFGCLFVLVGIFAVSDDTPPKHTSEPPSAPVAQETLAPVPEKPPKPELKVAETPEPKPDPKPPKVAATPESAPEPTPEPPPRPVAAPEPPAPVPPNPIDHKYTLIEERDSSFGKRVRIIVEVAASDTATTQEARALTAMNAAVDAHRRTWPHVVTARVWFSADQNVLMARATYAPDGCGWSGEPCKQSLWTDVDASTDNPPYEEHEGTKFPRRRSAFHLSTDLQNWGRPSEWVTEQHKELACRNDLQCWGDKHSLRATSVCRPLIENSAKYDYEWTDGWLGAKLTKFRWKSRKTGVISYYGDQIKFQNGFGAWMRIGYWCDYNPATETASARVFERR